MRVDPRDLVEGVPILAVRGFLRRHGQRFNRIELTRAFGEEQGKRLLKVLLRDGFLVVAQSEPEEFTATARGGALAKALATRPVHRRTAERALSAFLDRCGELARNDSYLFTVMRAVLFGSFLSDAPMLGDIDIALGLRIKKTYLSRFAGRGFALPGSTSHSKRTPLELAFFEEKRARVFLKNRSRIIQFTSIDDGVLEQAPSKVIFQDVEYVSVK